ncbi:tRNA pseudouridine synthase-like 1 [Pollicipes pollicipes]|uniref:tRNA pseudouridine synthase-like 1 n=1 Tax=Pollicipes pollicipes TaxID=41117 RepID=UPI0018851C6F|nr:tRNA pseudouridine synthase-like 1 [Pollicipes pollicipes]
MQRYLVFFSYIGTRFRGAQVQLPPGPRLEPYEDRSTVQGMFNLALCHFRSANTPVFVLSSRTDSGVHALSSSGHVDLAHPYHEEGRVFRPARLLRELNRYFDKTATEISVQRVLCVPETFHARFSAVSRAYLFRLGVVRAEAWPPDADRTACADP